MICLLIASGSISITVYAATHPSWTTTIETGSMIDMASYVIFKDGSTYFAKNGTTGVIEFSGTNASQIIQSASEAEGTICFVGSFEITHAIQISNDVKFEGGWFYTDNDIYMFQVTIPTIKLSMTNMGFEHRGDTGGILNASDGVIRGRFDDLKYVSAISTDYTGSLFYLGGYSNNFGNTFTRCSFISQSNVSHNLIFYQGSELVLDACKFGNNKGNQSGSRVYMSDSTWGSIQNCGFECVTLLIGGSKHVINNNWFSLPPAYGIVLYKSSYNLVENNLIGYNPTYPGTYTGIKIYGEATGSSNNNTISNNIVFSAGANSKGIYEAAYADYNLYIGNNCRGINGIGIEITGANSKVHLCWNGTNWIA